jgi:hypothetical protein
MIAEGSKKRRSKGLEKALKALMQTKQRVGRVKRWWRILSDACNLLAQNFSQLMTPDIAMFWIYEKESGN